MTTVHKLMVLANTKNEEFIKNIKKDLRKLVLHNLFCYRLNNYIYVENKNGNYLTVIRQYID
jgi:hypothetical protein